VRGLNPVGRKALGDLSQTATVCALAHDPLDDRHVDFRRSPAKRPWGLQQPLDLSARNTDPTPSRPLLGRSRTDTAINRIDAYAEKLRDLPTGEQVIRPSVQRAPSARSFAPIGATRLSHLRRPYRNCTYGAIVSLTSGLGGRQGRVAAPSRADAETTRPS
jgi:hypothetical protein